MPTFQMTLSLGVIDHLGLNLYSNVPAVLSELVANAWDADAKLVDIVVDLEAGEITIKDDGHGMDVDDVNEKFLMVGYKRRLAGSPTTDSGRHVMGRKGIGKLSTFSVAEEIEVHTVKSGEDGVLRRCGFILRTSDIRRAIEEEGGDYHPEEVDAASVAEVRGTRLTLKGIKKRITQGTVNAMRTRLARRFSIIGAENDFEVRINNTAVGVADRDYFDRMEYVWSVGGVGDRYSDLATNAKKKEVLDGKLDPLEYLDSDQLDALVAELPDDFDAFDVTGWVGTFDEQSSIADGNNSVVVMAWGKLIHEDILKEVQAGGLYTKYLMGELHADFLDHDSAEDIITSNRQSLREDDPRAVLFRNWLKAVVMSTVQNRWRDWRRDQALARATENDAVKEWYGQLSPTNKMFAKKLFGKIGSFPLEDDNARRELYRHAILAFERLQMKERLHEIEQLPEGPDASALLGLVQTQDDLEAALYHQIAQGRLAVIKRFEKLIDDNEKEKVVQEFLFDHLWLLDPSWERGTLPEARIEQAIKTVFEEDAAKLSDEERASRLDICLRTNAGRFVVIELKRYKVSSKGMQLVEQVQRYRAAVQKCLSERFQVQPDVVDVILVLGRPPSDLPVETFEKYLDVASTRWVSYDSLITDAQASYREYLAANQKISRILALFEQV